MKELAVGFDISYDVKYHNDIGFYSQIDLIEIYFQL